jgi:hypothetical protein
LTKAVASQLYKYFITLQHPQRFFKTIAMNKQQQFLTARITIRRIESKSTSTKKPQQKTFYTAALLPDDSKHNTAKKFEPVKSSLAGKYGLDYLL